jgi:hypothetical protein
VKVEPVEATAVRVTTVLLAKLYEQVEPQSMPLGELVTVPVPVPALVTVRRYVRVKVAVTDLAALMVTTQGAVPEQPEPDQPVKVEPVEATAVRVTTVL